MYLNTFIWRWKVLPSTKWMTKAQSIGHYIESKKNKNVKNPWNLLLILEAFSSVKQA